MILSFQIVLSPAKRSGDVPAVARETFAMRHDVDLLA